MHPRDLKWRKQTSSLLRVIVGERGNVLTSAFKRRTACFVVFLLKADLLKRDEERRCCALSKQPAAVSWLKTFPDQDPSIIMAMLVARGRAEV